MDVREIVSDAEIDRVHANANFGDESKRDVVDGGVIQYALGFTTGYTLLMILMEHGLVRRPRRGRYATTLTKKGRNYFRALFDYSIIDKMLAMRRATSDAD